MILSAQSEMDIGAITNRAGGIGNIHQFSLLQRKCKIANAWNS